MPTVHREAGFRFIIYFDDHEPAHVHVWHAGSFAKITVGDAGSAPEVVDPGTMRASKVREALRIVEAHQKRFIAAWRWTLGA